MTQSARTRTTGLIPSNTLPPNGERVRRLLENAGMYELEIKVRIVSDTLAYLDYKKNQINNNDHREVVSLNWIDRWKGVTLRQKVKIKSDALLEWMKAYNEDVRKRRQMAKELEEEINVYSKH